MRQLGKVLVASAVLAGVAWGAAAGLAAALPGPGPWRQAVIGLVPVAVGAGAYFAMARLLGIAELTDLVEALRRRRGPRAGPAGTAQG